MTEIEIPKPDVSSAIKMFAKNNYAGTLTGEAFKDLFDLIESQKQEIELWKNAYDEGDPVLKDEIERQKEEIEILKSSLQSIKEHSSDRASAAAASSALKMASRIQEGNK